MKIIEKEYEIDERMLALNIGLQCLYDYYINIMSVEVRSQFLKLIDDTTPYKENKKLKGWDIAENILVQKIKYKELNCEKKSTFQKKSK